MRFDELFEAATRQAPYLWQQRVADSGLPEVVDIETGAGKTAGLVLGWLFRRSYHPDPQVRAATPPWLVFALPMRSLVDQTVDVVRGWLASLDQADVRCYRLLGGEGPVDAGWRERPGHPTVIVATVDMLLSRALMRGYGVSRWTWPVEFGLLHAGCHWVFDEVQLLGPALATGRQLDAFRQRFGVAAACSSTWMSATLAQDRLVTVDNPHVPEPVTLGDGDRAGDLARRLAATRLVAELTSSDPRFVADAAVNAHRPGTLTLVVVNEVKRSRDVFTRVRKQVPRHDRPEVEILHSRFRPADRRAIVNRAINAPVDTDGPGRIVVATQVVEAGLDIDAATLITDAAPWSSIVQRAGRCNRAGEFTDARLLWMVPPRPVPYDPGDIAAATHALRSLEGRNVTSTTFRELALTVSEAEPVVAVLRRRDMIDLFDTSPDLVGNDIDVGRFIRTDQDTDVQVAWRHADPEGADDGPPFSGGPIQADELCRVPISAARIWIKSIGPARGWIADHLGGRNAWRRAVDPFDIVPGAIVVVGDDAGGYDPTTGWDGSTKRPVPVVPPEEPPLVDAAPVDERTADDPATFTGTWVGLDDHLGDTEQQASELVRAMSMDGLTPTQIEAVVRASAFHDLGKAHEVFQATLVASAAEARRDAAERLKPLAKSGGPQRARHRRPHFRHELVSALMLGAHADTVFADSEVDRNLVRYLVAAHHGRVRLAIRSIPGERPPPERRGARVALGVVHGDLVPGVTVRGMDFAETVLSLDTMELGDSESWTAMALELRDRRDLGPFRLATLEALVRIADWRASAAPSTVLDLDADGEAS